MFIVTANSCQNPAITYERNDVQTILGAIRMANALHKGFRSVEVTDCDTGETCLTKYASDDFYVANLDWSSAIDHAENEFYYETHEDERPSDPIEMIKIR